MAPECWGQMQGPRDPSHLQPMSNWVLALVLRTHLQQYLSGIYTHV